MARKSHPPISESLCKASGHSISISDAESISGIYPDDDIPSDLHKQVLAALVSVHARQFEREDQELADIAAGYGMARETEETIPDFAERLALAIQDEIDRLEREHEHVEQIGWEVHAACTSNDDEGVKDL